MLKFILLVLLALTLINCKECPECLMTTPELCQYYGYKSETRNTTTEDGYILTVHRILPTKEHINGGNPVIFLQHGLLDCSATWVLNGKVSLGFMLADAGFDVWMGNTRGNTYSNSHIKFPLNSDAFWNFTLDDMAKYDLPALIDSTLIARDETELLYIGHSQGSEIAFIKFSTDKSLSKKVKMFVALAPIARVTHVKGLFAFMSKHLPTVERMFRFFGIRDFLPSNWFMKMVATFICPWGERLCRNVIFTLAGYDKSNFNTSRVEIYEAHIPAGTSTKNMIHWSQMIRSHKLQMYDFEDTARNLIAYNQTVPPEYSISGLDVPTVLVQGGMDWLGDPNDELWLMEQIHKTVQDIIYIDYYNHLDVIWGEDAPQMVYNPIINIMNNALK